MPSATRPARLGLALIVLLSAHVIAIQPAWATAPANDDLASAIPLGGDLPLSASGTNVDATEETGEPDHAGNPGGQSVWYSWTAAVSAAVEIDTCGSDFDTLLAVYTGDEVASLTEIVSSDDSECGTASLVALEASAGATYRIAVDGWDGAHGAFELHVRQPAPPPNDDFAAAEIVAASVPVTVAGTNVDATSEPGEPEHGGPLNGGGRSVWYAWTPAVASSVRIDACGSDFGTLINVYTGVTVDAITPAGLDVPAPCGPGVVAVSLDASAGTTYRIAVDGIHGQQGNLQLNIDATDPPPNDAFDDAQVIAGPLPLTVTGTSVDATKEPGEPAHSGITGGQSVWYSWTAPISGAVVVESCNSDFFSVLAAYTGDDVASLTEVGVHLAAPCLLGEVVALDAVAGVTYSIAIDGRIGDAGAVLVTIRAATPPPNDDFDDAAMVGAHLPVTASGTNLDATKEEGEPFHAGNQGGSSVWYSWTPATDGRVVIETCDSGMDTLLGVYVGDSVGALTPVESSNDACGTGSVVQIDAVGGTTYRIAVDGLLGNTGIGQGTVVLNLRAPTPPPNDDFLAARVLTGSLPITAAGTNVDATTEPTEPDHGEPGGASVWYSWTAAASGSVTVDTCGSDFDTMLAVYEGSTVGSLSEVAVSNDHPFCNVRSVVTFDAAAGVTYRIAVDGSFSSSIGALGRVELAITAPPTNDDRAGAAGLTGPLPLSVFGSTFNASKEAAEPQHAGNPGGRSVWYSWTPGESGEVTVDTCNAGFDTLLAVYVEPSPGSLSGVAANDDACGDRDMQSLVTFDATAGTTYLIAVDGFFSQLVNASSFGTFTLRIYGDEAPSLVPHDDFDDAAVLAGPLPITRVGTTFTATAEIGEPDHAAMPGGASVWYSWTAPVSGPVSVDTCGSSFDTLLAIYTGNAVGALTEVASNDNGFGFCLLGSEVDFDAVAGTEYRIAVDGAFGIQGYLYVTVSSNDHAAPDTTIDTGPSGPTPDTAPSFGFSATETGSTFECSLDAAAFAICEPGDVFGLLEPGQHALAVRAVDPAGNIDPTPATREFEVVSCTISGTPGSDLLIGTAGNDVICGGAGNDIIVAARGDDIVFAGAGHDLVLAGRGRDHCDGGAGFDLALECEVRVNIP